MLGWFSLYATCMLWWPQGRPKSIMAKIGQRVSKSWLFWNCIATHWQYPLHWNKWYALLLNNFWKFLPTRTKINIRLAWSLSCQVDSPHNELNRSLSFFSQGRHFYSSTYLTCSQSYGHNLIPLQITGYRSASLNPPQTASDYDNGIISPSLTHYATFNQDCTAHIFTSITWGAECNKPNTNKSAKYNLPNL